MFDKAALEFLTSNLNQFEIVSASIDSKPASELLALAPGVKLESLELYQSAPNRIRQTPKLLSCQSFLEYVTEFKEEGTSIYLDTENASFVAILDHPTAGKPSWCSHRASYKPKLSLQWRAWTEINRAKMTQIELAHFIEERFDDFIKPEANVMLKSALDFQATEKLALGSSANLDNGGVKFTFTKDNVSKTVTFPHRIKIAVPVFENEEPTELEARVRYRTTAEGVLSFTISLVLDPRMILRRATSDIAEEIREFLGTCNLYEGTV